MFQNISTDYVEERQTNTKNLKENFIKQNFSKQLVLIYVLSFMVSIVQFGNNMAPFAIAIIAAITANNIPILIPYAITCIGTFIGFGGSGLLTYILTSLVFMALSIFVIPKMNDQTGQKSLMPHLIVATLLVQIVKIFFGPILIYDILSSILLTIITSIFYKIFKSSISVIKDSKTKKSIFDRRSNRDKFSNRNSNISIWRISNIWVFYKKYFMCFSSTSFRMAKWNLNRCNIWSNNRRSNCDYTEWRSGTNCSICNLWYDSRIIKQNRKNRRNNRILIRKYNFKLRNKWKYTFYNNGTRNFNCINRITCNAKEHKD